MVSMQSLSQACRYINWWFSPLKSRQRGQTKILESSLLCWKLSSSLLHIFFWTLFKPQKIGRRETRENPLFSQSLAATGMNGRSGKDGTELKQRQLSSYKVKRDVSKSACRRLGKPNQIALSFNHQIPSRVCQALWFFLLFAYVVYSWTVSLPCASTPLAFPAYASGLQWSSRVWAPKIRQGTDNWWACFYSWPWYWLTERLWTLNSSWHLLPQRYRGDNAVHPLHGSLVCSAAQDKTKSKQNKAKQTTQTKSAGVKFSVLFSLKQKLFSLI